MKGESARHVSGFYPQHSSYTLVVKHSLLALGGDNNGGNVSHLWRESTFCSSDLEAEEDVKAQRKPGFGSNLGCFMSLRQRCRKGREGMRAEVAENVDVESTTGNSPGAWSWGPH